MLRLVDTDVAAMPRAHARANASAAAPTGRRSVLVATPTGTTGGPGRGAPAAAQRQAEFAVGAENARAANLSALDARWMLAVQVTHVINAGGPAGARAGFLAPERRRLLVAEGARLGLRPFDTNLVIAVVQDAARAGADPLGHEARARLALIRGTPEHDLRSSAAAHADHPGAFALGTNHIAAAIVLAGVWAYLLAGWILGQ